MSFPPSDSLCLIMYMVKNQIDSNYVRLTQEFEHKNTGRKRMQQAIFVSCIHSILFLFVRKYISLVLSCFTLFRIHNGLRINRLTLFPGTRHIAQFFFFSLSVWWNCSKISGNYAVEKKMCTYQNEKSR